MPLKQLTKKGVTVTTYYGMADQGCKVFINILRVESTSFCKDRVGAKKIPLNINKKISTQSNKKNQSAMVLE